MAPASLSSLPRIEIRRCQSQHKPVSSRFFGSQLLFSMLIRQLRDVFHTSCPCIEHCSIRGIKELCVKNPDRPGKTNLEIDSISTTWGSAATRLCLTLSPQLWQTNRFKKNWWITTNRAGAEAFRTLPRRSARSSPLLKECHRIRLRHYLPQND